MGTPHCVSHPDGPRLPCHTLAGPEARLIPHDLPSASRRPVVPSPGPSGRAGTIRELAFAPAPPPSCLKCPSPILACHSASSTSFNTQHKAPPPPGSPPVPTLACSPSSALSSARPAGRQVLLLHLCHRWVPSTPFISKWLLFKLSHLLFNTFTNKPTSRKLAFSARRLVDSRRQP